MTHEVALNLTHEIHDHDNHDQQRSTTEIERHVKELNHGLWHQRHRGDVCSTPDSQPSHNLVNVLAGLFTWANTRNERPRTL